MKALDFDNVNLVARELSMVESREDILYLTKLGDETTIPILPAPMVDVAGTTLYKAALTHHSAFIPFIHRFQSQLEQLYQAKEFGLPCYISVGLDTSLDYYLDKGYDKFCLDVANGYNIRVGNYLADAPKCAKFVVGNVCSKEGFAYLQRFHNVVGVRVGVAGGTGCTTKDATGVYHPMISLLQECRKVKKDKFNTAIIADGGINSPDRACKALAFGADLVMMGSQFGQCKESPAKIVTINSKSFKEFSGSASEEIQKIYKEEPKYIEGRTVLLPYNNEAVSSMIDRYLEGLRSSMSYMNAVNLQQYRERMKYVVV